MPDSIKTKILAAADLFQTQFTHRSNMTFISYEEDPHNELLYSFFFQDKQQQQLIASSSSYSPDKIYKLVAQIIQPLSGDIKVIQSEDAQVRVFRIDLSAEDLLSVRPEVFQVLRHPKVQATVVYLLVFVSIALLSLYWL